MLYLKGLYHHFSRKTSKGGHWPLPKMATTTGPALIASSGFPISRNLHQVVSTPCGWSAHAGSIGTRSPLKDCSAPWTIYPMNNVPGHCQMAVSSRSELLGLALLWAKTVTLGFFCGSPHFSQSIRSQRNLKSSPFDDLKPACKAHSKRPHLVPSLNTGQRLSS